MPCLNSNDTLTRFLSAFKHVILLDPHSHCLPVIGRLLRCPPNDPCLMIFTSSVIPSSWMWTGPRDLPLTNKIGQKQCNITFVIRLQKLVTSVLLADSLIGFKASCHVGQARDREHSLTNSQWASEVLSPITEELNSSNNDVSELGNESFPSWAFWLPWLQLVRDPEDSDNYLCVPGETVIINMCCFKLPSVGVICYTV